MTPHEQVQRRIVDIGVRLDSALAEVEQLRASAAATRVGRASKALVVGIAVVSACVFVAAAGAPGKRMPAPFRVFGNNRTHPMLVIGADPTSQAPGPNGEAPDPAKQTNLMQLYSGSDMVLKVQASESHSFFSALSPDGKATTSLGADGAKPYLRLRTNLKERVSLDVTGGKPYVRLKGADGHGVLELHEAPGGGGELLMAQPGGLVRVKAGSSEAGIGRVEVWPQDNRYTRGSPIGALLVGQR